MRRAFATILVTLAPSALAQGCARPAASHDGGTGGAKQTWPRDDGGADADADSSSIADADAGGDAFALDACMSSLVDPDGASDAPFSCTLVLPCGLPDGLTAVGCDVYLAGTPLGCNLVPDAGCAADAYAPPSASPVLVYCALCPSGGGRRPAGLRRARTSASSAIGAYFTRMTYEEAAAVHAFRRLRDELAAHEAPAPLLAAAERAARDERRHARVMAGLARSNGGEVVCPHVRATRGRGLEAIARENAVEGCVNETFGALLLAFQATTARDTSLRRSFQILATDEARHAALAWAIAHWVAGRLDPAARARVEAARRRAVFRLRSVGGPLAPDAELGLPDAAQHAALVDALGRQLGFATPVARTPRRAPRARGRGA